MSENVVYVIQDVPGKNLLPAKEFGKLHVILSGKEVTQHAVWKLADDLSRMTSEDYLLLIGHPINIAIASHIALTALSGRVNFLVWDRVNYKYEKQEVELCQTSAMKH
jgi:hypothetical protein